MAKKLKVMDAGFVPCTLRQLPRNQSIKAATIAADMNPANKVLRQFVSYLTGTDPDDDPGLTPERIAVMTTKYWQAKGVDLTVAFLDNPGNALANKIVEHMNEWGKHGNVRFHRSTTDPQVRIARANTGYWSYLGTDILSIPKREATMNLQGFTLNTPDSEYRRVVFHETGHTMGFPHEHMRKELVERLDVSATINYFRKTQGWSAQEVREQVLTPVPESELIATEHADEESIMCYQLPASITKDGKPITGGDVINARDAAFVAKIYPKAIIVTPPVDPSQPRRQVTVTDPDGKVWVGELLQKTA